MNVALVSAAPALGFDEDLAPLGAALSRAGATSQIVCWDDAKVDWNTFDVAVVRSTWDYALRRDAFVTWARSLPVPLMNDAEIVAWNTDKRYLAELEARGIAITPTTWIAPGDALRLPNGNDEIVVKPAISGGARDTARYPRSARSGAEAHVRRLNDAGRVAMVQPYQTAVDTAGETALVFFDGAFSHAIRKGPLLVPGAAVVEELFAAESIASRSPSAAERAMAERVLDAVPGGRASLVYARVDLVPGADGAPLLLELELTEPSVFLAQAPDAADAFAQAIVRRASKWTTTPS